MKIFRVLFGLSLILAAISTFGMSVKTDYDKNFNLGGLKTFAFRDQQRGDADPLKTDTLNGGRIESGLTSSLEKAGFKNDTNGEPDFYIAYYAGAKEKLDVESFGYGYPRFWRRGYGQDIWTRYYTEGSIVADFIDAKTKQLVWRGIVTDTVSGSTDKYEKQINQASDELVKHFVKDAGKGGGKNR